MGTESVTSAEQTVAHSTHKLWHDSTFIPSVIAQTRLMFILFPTLGAYICFRNITIIVYEERS